MADNGLPLGIRNNNPGNIRFGAGFDGEQEGENGFGAYASPELGGMALIKNLVAYSTKHGLNTVQGIIGRWAPPNENNTSAYINNVAQDLGVQPGDTLNMKDPGTLAKLATAIAKHEGNGSVFDAAFFDALANNNPTLAAYVASSKLPAFMKQQARSEAFRANPSGPGEPSRDMNMDAYNRVWDSGGAIEEAAAIQSGQEEALNLRWAGFGESFWDGVVSNITGRLWDVSERGEYDPEFKVDAAHLDQMAARGILVNQQLTDFVAGARNQQDFERRLNLSEERLDYFQRLSNTPGLRGIAAGAGNLLGGVADPVAIIATLGTGWVFNVARAGAGLSLVRSMAGGAVGNIAASQIVEHLDNQRFHWNDLVGQGVMGAALGAMGHLLTIRSQSRRAARALEGEPVPDPVAQHVAANLQDVVDNRLREAQTTGTVDPLTGEFNDGISTDLFARNGGRAVHFTDDVPNLREAMTSMEERRALREEAEASMQGPQPTDAADAVREEETAIPVRERIRDAVYRERPRQAVGEALSARRELERMTQEASDPLVKGLAGRLLEQLRDDVPMWKINRPDGRASWFKLAENRIELIPAHWESDAVKLHEISHAVTAHKIEYGLRNPTSVHGQLAKELEALRNQANRLYKGKDKEARYYLKNIHEFVAGLYSGHTEFIDHLRGITLPAGKSILSRAVDIIRSILGIKPEETNALTRAMGLADKLVDAPLKTKITFRQGVVRETLSSAPVDGDRQITMTPKAQAVYDAAMQWNETSGPEAMTRRERLKKWYEEWRPKLGIKGANSLFDSPSLTLQMSKSKVARFLGAHLFEDPTGIGKRESTVALDYEMAQAGYKYMALPRVKELLLEGMTRSERMSHAFGDARAAEARVFEEVAVEHQKKRQAALAGEQYTSEAPAHIKEMSKLMDDFYYKMASDGVRAGNPMAGHVMGLKPVGYMPYAWVWEKIQRAFTDDKPRWNALYDNITQQYRERIVDPAMDDFMKQADADPAAAAELRARLEDKVKRVVDNKLRTLMSDPQSRIDGMEVEMETIAGEILDEDFHGVPVDGEMIQTFKERLRDIRRDKSRTEMDLLREVNGVRLLDFMDTNLISQITKQSHRWAGLNALAKKGFTDLDHVAAAKEAARLDGATADEVAAIDFAFRSFGIGQIRNHERAAATNLRNATYLAIGGKLGLAVAADLGNVVAASGVSGFLRTLPGIMDRKDLWESLTKASQSLLGQDYRIHAMTPDVAANGRLLIGEGSLLQRALQQGAGLMSWVNGSNLVQRLLHRGFVPMMAEDVMRTIRGMDGGVTPARLADMGIDGDMLTRIKAQLEKHEAGRKDGDAMHWDNWDDQEAADQLIGSINRVTFQTFQRALVGEAPAWLSEGTVGALVGQFRRYGLVSMEKQLVRNLSMWDVNTVTALTVSTAWAGMLYYSRLMMNTSGMDPAARDQYIEENTKGFKLASGVLNLLNMSGMLPEFMNLGELLFSGNSYQVGSGSVAASLGYLGNLGKAAHAAGNLLTGQSTNENADMRHILRAMPFGNSLVGTYYSNTLNQ